MRVEVLPVDAAVVLTLVGEAALDAGGPVGAQIESALTTVFGSAPALDPPPFVYRRTFRLGATGLPESPVGPPRFACCPGGPEARRRCSTASRGLP